MSTTYKGLAVSFKTDISEDRANAIKTAFQLLAGVAEVRLVEAQFPPNSRTGEAVQADFWEKISDVVCPKTA